METKKNHKFDVFDECVKCGLTRKKVPFVGDGFNAKFVNRFDFEYSYDGVVWVRERPNCVESIKKC
jgi:hypothetical protein